MRGEGPVDQQAAFQGFGGVRYEMKGKVLSTSWYSAVQGLRCGRDSHCVAESSQGRARVQGWVWLVTGEQQPTACVECCGVDLRT